MCSTPMHEGLGDVSQTKIRNRDRKCYSRGWNIPEILRQSFVRIFKFEFYRKVFKMVTFLTIFAHRFELPVSSSEAPRPRRARRCSLMRQVLKVTLCNKSVLFNI